MMENFVTLAGKPMPPLAKSLSLLHRISSCSAHCLVINSCSYIFGARAGIPAIQDLTFLQAINMFMYVHTPAGKTAALRRGSTVHELVQLKGLTFT